MTREEIIPAIIAALAAEFPDVIIVENDYSQAAVKAMEEALRTDGVVLVVPPIYGTRKKSQAGSRITELVTISVHIRVNRAVAAHFNIYGAHTRLIDAVLGSDVVRASADDELCSLVAEDVGNVTHAFRFSLLLSN